MPFKSLEYCVYLSSVIRHLKIIVVELNALNEVFHIVIMDLFRKLIVLFVTIILGQMSVGRIVQKVDEHYRPKGVHGEPW